MAASVLALGLYGLATLQGSLAASVSASAGSGSGATSSSSSSSNSNSHSGSHSHSNYCPVISTGSSSGCTPLPKDFLSGPSGGAAASAQPDVQILKDVYQGLAVMQNKYFNPGRMTWPSAIDWTAAVIQTIMSGSMSTLTRSMDIAAPDADWKEKENLLSFLHEQVVSAYFGQDAQAIKGEAFDDILWVVLGWIEAMNFRRLHEELHYPEGGHSDMPLPQNISMAVDTMPWHGQFWTGTFAHRAEDFWDLGATGWDTTLCHGGMNWNPRLLPYKNAITNELYISASISMYRYFPGSPYDGTPSRNPRHLQAAIQGYKWLSNVNMTNSQGLYVDGYHVNRSIPGNVECDERNEMVYTYNQGVVLTGLRGLFGETGAPSYVEDGHDLIRSVIKATGWDIKKGEPVDDAPPPGELPPFHGIGRGGILEEFCDASGSCSQDAQTFKGIFMHHLAAFCRPLELTADDSRAAVNAQALAQVKQAHTRSCRSYIGWLKYNADAALNTRDSDGRFGMWWAANLYNNVQVGLNDDGINHFAPNTTDYRNEGTPENAIWSQQNRFIPGGGNATAQASGRAASGDPNDRGRGRTVETQSGGISVLRAYWEVSQTK